MDQRRPVGGRFGLRNGGNAVSQAGLLFAASAKRHLPAAACANIILIVALQTAFDLSSPQVSLSAHLGGFLTGVLIGMILAAKRRPATRPESAVTECLAATNFAVTLFRFFL
jgi:membrane associated rhomboid family serine protease